MTLTELATQIGTLSIPYAYGLFPEANRPSAPYIEYQVAYSSNFSADSKVYKKFNHVDIFLFTAKKDVATETQLETLLDNNNLFYDKTETYLNDDRVYQIIYEVKIDG